MTYEDMRGGEIKVGSLLAMPFAKSSTGYMRVGRVVELVPPKTSQWGAVVPKRLRIEWLVHTEYSPPRVSMVTNYGNALLMPENFPLGDSDEAGTD